MAGPIDQEHIPDPAWLYCRVHRNQYDQKAGRILSPAFGKLNQSADWAKYSTPEQTVARARKPQENIAVAFISAGACRTIGQEVAHMPLGDEAPGGRNDAHSEIRGDKTEAEAKSRLRDAVAEIWYNPNFLG